TNITAATSCASAVSVRRCSCRPTSLGGTAASRTTRGWIEIGHSGAHAGQALRPMWRTGLVLKNSKRDNEGVTSTLFSCMGQGVTVPLAEMTAPHVERPRVPRIADERAMLVAWLEFHRATLLMKCAGLSDDQLKLRSAEPATL